MACKRSPVRSRYSPPQRPAREFWQVFFIYFYIFDY
jgi:hypothetical protein